MTGHINVVLVLQSCTDPLQVTAGSSTETFPTSSDGTYGVGNVKVEEDLDIKEEAGIYGEEEEHIDTEEEEDVDVKEEVS
jgi:hypothetical protein